MFLVRLLLQAVAGRSFRSRRVAVDDRSGREAAAGHSAGTRQGGSANAAPEPIAMRLGAAISAINETLAVSAAVKVLDFGMLAALMFLFVSALFGHQFGSAVGWANPFALHHDVFWLGLYILMAELLGQLIKLNRAQRAAGSPARARQQPHRTLPALDWLFFEGVRTHGAHILFSEPGEKRARAAPASAPAEESTPKLPALRKIERLLRDNSNLTQEQIAGQVGDFENFIRHPRHMVLHEPLHPLHFSIIFALCEQQQSQGRMSLVVCPERLISNVSKSLEGCASESFAGLVQRGAVLRRRGQGWRRDLSYSYVVVADTDLERELLGPGGDSQSLLENLGMIVAIEAESLQMSFLRLQLPRVWLRVPRKRIKVLVQVGSLVNHPNLIQALLPLVANEQPLTVTLNFAASSSTHKIVWANGPPARDSILGAYLPEAPRQSFSTALSLVTYALYGAEKARRTGIADINLSEAEEAEGQLSQFKIARTQQPIGGAFTDATRESRQAAARVVIIDEDASILTALAGFYDRFRHGEVLVNVVAHAYPLRDYQADQLARQGSSSIVSQGAQMAADPRGGLREMLSTLYYALRERRGDLPDDHGLRRSQIINQFLRLLPLELRSQINLIPGRDGFERLFKEIDVALKINVRREESETRYEIDGGSQGDFPELHFSIPVLVDNQDRGFHVPAGDIGLSILPRQSVLLGGHEHVIRRIDKSHILSERNQNPKPEVTVPILDYVWRSRRSATPVDARADRAATTSEITRNWLLDNKTSWANGSAAHYYASFTRQTVGKIVCPYDMRPLSDARSHLPVSPLYEPEQHERRRDYQSVWHLRFNKTPLLRENGPAELALTTCVTLQDVVRGLFPSWRHRINVVSPAADNAFKERRAAALRDPTSFNEAADRVDVLLACAYPRLRLGEPTAGSTQPVGLDIFLIEDSDFDLGVVRRLQTKPDALFEEVIKYLSWLKGIRFSSRYHRFGAPVDGKILMFERTLKMMRDAQP
jgi:hypothetical protein